MTSIFSVFHPNIQGVEPHRESQIHHPSFSFPIFLYLSSLFCNNIYLTALSLSIMSTPLVCSFPVSPPPASILFIISSPLHFPVSIISLCPSHSYYLSWLYSPISYKPAVTFGQRKLNQNPSGMSWITTSQVPSINMSIHKELMGTWEWNPIRSNRIACQELGMDACMRHAQGVNTALFFAASPCFSSLFAHFLSYLRSEKPHSKCSSSKPIQRLKSVTIHFMTVH